MPHTGILSIRNQFVFIVHDHFLSSSQEPYFEIKLVANSGWHVQFEIQFLLWRVKLLDYTAYRNYANIVSSTSVRFQLDFTHCAAFSDRQNAK